MASGIVWQKRANWPSFVHVLMVLHCSHTNWSYPSDLFGIPSHGREWQMQMQMPTPAFSRWTLQQLLRPRQLPTGSFWVLISHVANVSPSGWISHEKWLHLAHDLISELSDTLCDDLQVYIDKAFEDLHWLLGCMGKWRHNVDMSRSLFCWNYRSSKLPKTQPVSWPKCWNCEPKVVSNLIILHGRRW